MLTNMARVLQERAAARRGAAGVPRAVSPRRRRSRYLAAVASAVALTAGLSIPAAGAASAAPAPYVFQNIGSGTAGLCLGTDDGQQYAGGSIITRTCSSSDPFQQWTATVINNPVNTPDGVVYPVQLKNVGGAGLCLDVNYYAQYAGASPIQWTCSTSDPLQQWTKEANGNTGVNYCNVGTGLCLDTNYYQQDAGSSVLLWTRNYSDSDQQWSFYLTQR